MVVLTINYSCISYRTRVRRFSLRNKFELDGRSAVLSNLSVLNSFDLGLLRILIGLIANTIIVVCALAVFVSRVRTIRMTDFFSIFALNTKSVINSYNRNLH